MHEIKGFGKEDRKSDRQSYSITTSPPGFEKLSTALNMVITNHKSRKLTPFFLNLLFKGSCLTQHFRCNGQRKKKMNNFVIEHLIWQETTIPINLTNTTCNVNSVNSVQSLSNYLVSVFSLPKEPTYNMQFSCPYRRIPVAVKFRYSEKAISSYMYCCHRIVSSLFL